MTQQTDKAHFQIMATIAKSLTEQEIRALGSYLQGLHNRADDVAAAAPRSAVAVHANDGGPGPMTDAPRPGGGLCSLPRRHWAGVVFPMEMDVDDVDAPPDAVAAGPEPLSVLAAPAPAALVEGKDYEVIGPRPARAAGRQDRSGGSVRLHLPALRPLRAAPAGGRRSCPGRALHAGAGRVRRLLGFYARAYYAADQLGVAKRSHAAMFEALHERARCRCPTYRPVSWPASTRTTA